MTLLLLLRQAITAAWRFTASRFRLSNAARIATSTSAAATQWSSTPKILFASDGTAIALYFNGTGISFSTASSPYRSWSSSTTVLAGSSATVSALIDGSDAVHVLTKDSTNNYPQYVKLTKSGTTWTVGTVQQIDVNYGGGSNEPWHLLRDGSGRFWAVGFAYNAGSYLYAYYGTDGGTANGVTSWTRSVGFTSAATTNIQFGWNAAIAGNYLVLMYSNSGTSVYRRLDTTGSLTAWTAETTIGTTGLWEDHTAGSFLADGSNRAIFTSQPGGSNDYAIRTLVYTSGTDTWSATNDIGTNTTDRYPSLVNINGDLYCIWCEYGGSANNFAIVYKRWSNASGTWGSKVTLEPNGYNQTNVVAGSLYPYTLAWIWTEGTASPYTIGFDYISFGGVRDTISRFRLQSLGVFRFTSSRFGLLANAWRTSSTRYLLRSATTYRDQAIRTRVRSVNVYVDTPGRFRLVSPTTWRMTATRYLIRSATTFRDTALRARLLANSWRTSSTRYAIRSATTYRDQSARARLMALAYAMVSTRFKLSYGNSVNIATRLLVRATSFRDTSSRAQIRSNSTRDTSIRASIKSATTYRDQSLRARLQALAYRFSSSRFNVAASGVYRDLVSRFRLVSPSTLRDTAGRYKVGQAATPRDTSLRARIRALAYANVPTRASVRAQTTRDTQTRYRVQSPQRWRDGSLRAKLAALAYAVVPSRFRLQAQPTRDATTRLAVRSPLTWRVSQTRYRVQVLNTKDTSLRARISAWVTRDTASRYRLRSSIVYRDTQTRAVFQSGGYRHTLTRARLRSILVWQDTPLRVSVSSRVWRFVSSRISVATGGYRLDSARFALRSPGTFIFEQLRYKLASASAFAFVGSRSRISTPASINESTRYRLRAQAYRNMFSRFSIGNFGQSNAKTRYKLIANTIHIVGTRFGLKSIPTFANVNTRFSIRVYTGPEGQLVAVPVNDRRSAVPVTTTRIAKSAEPSRKAVAV